MGACGTFGRGFYFTVLTLITIGATSGLLITLLVFFVRLHLNEASSTVLAVIIVAMCVSILLLIYGFYASVYGGPCQKAVLSLIYLIFALAMGAFGICILALKKQITTAIGNEWNKGGDFVSNFEKQLKCQSWDNDSACNSPEPDRCCKHVFEDFYAKFGTGIGAGLIVLFVILMVGDVFAWKFVCEKAKKKDEKGPSQSLTTPLTFSW
jgi:hypothetical protein